MSKVTAIDIASVRNSLEGDSKVEEDGNVSSASSVDAGKGKNGSIDSIPARGLKSNSELTPRGPSSTVTALSKSTANGTAPSSTSGAAGTAHATDVTSPVTTESIRASQNRKNRIDEAAELMIVDVIGTPTRRKEDSVKPVKSNVHSPSMLRPLPAKNGRTKSSEKPMATPPLSTSPTPNDIKSGSASLMTYFTASERASPSTILQSNRPKTPTQTQEHNSIARNEKDNISKGRSLAGGQTDPTPGHYYEPPNAKLPADKTMEKSIALMISKAAENENKVPSPKGSASASAEKNTAKISTPKNKSDFTNIQDFSSPEKDKTIVTQSAGDTDIGPNDIIPALTFLSPDNNMAPLSTRYNTQLCSLFDSYFHLLFLLLCLALHFSSFLLFVGCSETC